MSEFEMTITDAMKLADYPGLISERDRLKAELDAYKGYETWDHDGMVIQINDLKSDRDAWKSKAEQLAAELAAQKLETLGLMGSVEMFKDKAGKLAEALRKIVAYGRPLEAPRASYATCEINDIAKAALDEFGKGV